MSNFTNIYPLVAAFLTGIAGPIGLTYVKHKLRAKNRQVQIRRTDFESAIETQNLINSSLNKLQERFNLDRIWIAQFHNGGHFYPGNKSMKKLSVTFESSAPGVATDIMRMQNLPVSFFSASLQKLNSGEESVVTDIHTEEDYALRSFWENRGANTVYLFPIRCLEGGFIGVLGIDLIKKDGFLPDNIYRELKNESILLSGYVAATAVEKE
jgi:hypothetical protein